MSALGTTRANLWCRLGCAAALIIGVTTAVAVTASGTAATAQAGTSAVHSDVAPPDPAPSSDTDTASQQAQQSGLPVVVADQTTETSQVMAEPDGTFDLTSSVTPVRVLDDDGSWRPIDTTLHTTPDGYIKPAATASDVRFSGGGTGPAVTVTTDDGDQVSMSWPTSLPTPTLDGATARYADVLPGVDLALTARADSYSEVLIVNNATAAANPALNDIHFGVHVDGLKIATAGSDGITATDDAGGETLHGPQPVMWDSSDGPTDPADATSPGATIPTQIPVSMSSADGTDSPANTTLILHPPASELTGSDVVYPVYIDPPLTTNERHFAVVTTLNNWHYYDDTSNDLKVGYCSGWTECNGSWKARTYLSFDTSQLTNRETTAQVLSATASPYEIHSAHDCTDEPVSLYTAHAFDSSTDWNSSIVGTQLQTASSHAGDGCASLKGGSVTFASNQNMINVFQNAANNDTQSIALALVATHENDNFDWKRFASSSVGNASAAQINVQYDFPPSTPQNLQEADAVVCPGQPDYVYDRLPLLAASATGHVPGDSVELQFSLYNYSADPSDGGRTGSASAASNQVVKWDVGTLSSRADLSDGSYKFNVYAQSEEHRLNSGTSGYQYFRIDATAPQPPDVTSFSYPPNTWGSLSGGTFQIAGAQGDTDIAGFTYSFVGSTSASRVTGCDYSTGTANVSGLVPADASGNGTISIDSQMTTGYHVLHVRSFDHAHNMSATETTYAFYVSPPLAQGPTMFEAESQTFTASGQGCGGSNTCQSYTGGPSSIWSNQKQLDLVDTAPQATWTAPVTLSIAADYAINFQFNYCGHCAQVQVAIDGTTLRVLGKQTSSAQNDPYTVDTCGIGQHNTAFGGLTLDKKRADGTPHQITITTVGTNQNCATGYPYNGTYGTESKSITANDHGYTINVDYFRIVPVNNATFGSLSAAMNNDGITADNSAAGDIEPSLAYRSLSQNALTSAGYGPGQTKSVDGATFTMPNYNSDGRDNVIAMGQTINITDNSSGANYLDLLVASTCGTTNPFFNDASIAISVNYGDAAKTYTATPFQGASVPDVFGSTAPTSSGNVAVTKAITLTSSRTGTTTNSSQATLFHLAVHLLGPGYPVRSITLPFMRGDLSEGCNASNLHVFAISTR